MVSLPGRSQRSWRADIARRRPPPGLATALLYRAFAITAQPPDSIPNGTPAGPFAVPTASLAQALAVEQRATADRHRVEERLHDEAAALGVAHHFGHALG